MSEPEETVYATPRPDGGYEPVSITTDVFYRIIIPGPRDVWVVFEKSNDELSESYWFHLVEKGGAYNETLPLSDASDIDDKLHGLCFPKVPPIGTYTLCLHHASDSVLTIFEELPWSELWNRRKLYEKLFETLGEKLAFQGTDFGDLELSKDAILDTGIVVNIDDEGDDAENIRDLIHPELLDVSNIFSFSESSELEDEV